MRRQLPTLCNLITISKHTLALLWWQEPVVTKFIKIASPYTASPHLLLAIRWILTLGLLHLLLFDPTTWPVTRSFPAADLHQAYLTT